MNNANNNLIVDQHEKSIAFNLILFGSWQDDLYVETINNSRCIVSTINPIQKSNEQFDMIGAMSSIISRKFKYLTSNIQDSTPVPIKIKSEYLLISILKITKEKFSNFGDFMLRKNQIKFNNLFII